MDVYDLSLSEASSALAERRLSSEALTAALLDRIGQLDDAFLAYSEVLAGSALAAARTADAERAKGFVRGPLHGIPIGVKDIIDVAGTVTVAGTRVKRDDPAANTDATVVARLRHAGAVLLGKHQLSESATLYHHPDVVAPRNPWSSDHWTGASSSGSGVAVSAGLAFGALGTDTGGSIRYPSAANGITGLKPSWGRVSRHGVLPYSQTLDHIGPMARTVEDCALLLQAIAGADPADPTAIPIAVPDYRAPLGRPIAGLRIGIDLEAVETHCDSTVVTHFDATLSTMTALGAQLVPMNLPDEMDAVMLAMAITVPEALLNHASYYPARAESYGPGLRAQFEIAPQINGTVVVQAMNMRARVRGLYDLALAGVDLILVPALQRALPTITDLDRYYPDSNGFAPDFGRFILPVNVSGHPSLSLPAGFDSDGLPIGVQLIGRPFDEVTLLQVGHAYQSITDWHTYRPSP